MQVDFLLHNNYKSLKMSMSHDLKSVCHICGKRLGKDRQKKVTAYTCTCSSYKLQLQEVFGITVDSDQSGIHPASFCQRCYSVMKRQQATTQENSLQALCGGVSVGKTSGWLQSLVNITVFVIIIT